MGIKKLFLAHYSGDAHELHQLALELRLHGVVPWVDKQGGFTVADESEVAARRAIREDCFGLLLYASRHVFDRWFIREVEIDEANKVRRIDPTFAIFAVPRRISFAQLSELSKANFEIDLSAFHTVGIPQRASLAKAFGHVAEEVLRKVLIRAHAEKHGTISIQFSTRERFPDEPNDILCFDAVQLFASGIDRVEAWNRLLQALQRAKREIVRVFGRPRLYVHGSKHLAAAFIFGRVFATFEMDIRQTPVEVWQSDAQAAQSKPFISQRLITDADDGRLFVEIASGYKNIGAGVDALLTQTESWTPSRLKLNPVDGPLRVDERLCRTMVDQTYAEIEQVMRAHPIREIHLFVAAPQTFMILLGKRMKGFPEVHLYEWDGVKYVYCCGVPGGVL